MNSDLQKAKELLIISNKTCVLCKSDTIYTSTERGVKPLLDWLEDPVDLQGVSVADKVVGKAAAFLYVLLKIKEIYAPVMSRGAVEIFVQYGIHAEYDCQVERIINRAGTGFCPMEEAVMEAATPEQAREAIIETMSRLM